MNVYDQESHSKRYRFLASIISSSASLFSLNVSIHNIFLILFTHEQYRSRFMPFDVITYLLLLHRFSNNDVTF